MDPGVESERRVMATSSLGRRLALPVLGFLAGAALLMACAKGADPSASTATTLSGSASVASTTTTTETSVPTYPLTGLPIKDPAQAALPALVIKIDNVDSTSRPQIGINQADIVYEEKIEGPISRFAAVFHTNELPDVGPIRSGRSTDVAIISTLNTPLYVFSGANDVFAKKLRDAPLVYIDYDHNTGLFERRAGRKAPDNVFSSSARLRAKTPEGAQPPGPQLSYRKGGTPLPAGAVAVKSFDYNWGGGPVDQPVTFTWDPAKKGWAREQKGSAHVDGDGVQITPTNVIVQIVPYINTGLFDLSKTPVPEAQLVGSGEAWVFVDGQATKATWNKPDNGSITTYTTADGTVIAVNPGQTWIALVPDLGNFAGTKSDGSAL